jgi:NAD(P)-dependent dehydrogenase (short-subunit alcohol dehydrogenase family)
MDLGLKGKSVLITGASKGIGLACAKAFAAEGSTVHLAARSADLLANAKHDMESRHGVAVHTHVCDLRAKGAVKQLADACGDIDVLVNNAGDIPGGDIAAIDEERWRHAWELKVFGYINLTREMLARMKPRGKGVIVNVVGMAGVTHPAEYICGTTGNAALEAFTKGAGKGSIEYGVRVLGMHPPATRTDRIIQLNKTIAKQKFGDESRWEELLKQTRMIEPEQVADTVLFFASERAAHLSGVMLNLGTY